MFLACCVVPILAQAETNVQPQNAFLAVFPMMRGVFFTFYTKITKLFPQCWPGNTKVFNILSTYRRFPGPFDPVFSPDSAFPAPDWGAPPAGLWPGRISPLRPLPASPCGGKEPVARVLVFSAVSTGCSCSGSFFRAKSSIFWPMPLPRALSVTKRCSTCPVLWCTLTVASGTSLV